jgi:hypothetical protein
MGPDERPCCQAADQGDELTSLQLIELHPPAPWPSLQHNGLPSISLQTACKTISGLKQKWHPTD